MLGLAVVAVILVEGVSEGPRIVRHAWELVGLRAVEGHADAIRAAARESGLDPCLLAGVMYVESKGDVDAVSSRGALGLFQLVPAAAGDAAKRLRIPEPSREDLLEDPLLNARLAANHLAWLVENEGPDLERVLAAYNAGRAKLRGWVKDAGSFEAWRAGREAAGGGGVLGYARHVLEARDRFRERGVVSSPELASTPSAPSAPNIGLIDGPVTGLPE